VDRAVQLRLPGGWSLISSESAVTLCPAGRQVFRGTRSASEGLSFRLRQKTILPVRSPSSGQNIAWSEQQAPELASEQHKA